MQSPAAEKECTYPPNSPKKLVWVTPSTRNSAISANSTPMIISIWCTVSGKWSYIFSFAFTKFLSPLFSRLFFPSSKSAFRPASSACSCASCGHVHNHIIFCAADNVNHEKYPETETCGIG